MRTKIDPRDRQLSKEFYIASRWDMVDVVRELVRIASTLNDAIDTRPSTRAEIDAAYNLIRLPLMEVLAQTIQAETDREVVEWVVNHYGSGNLAYDMWVEELRGISAEETA